MSTNQDTGLRVQAVMTKSRRRIMVVEADPLLAVHTAPVLKPQVMNRHRIDVVLLDIFYAVPPAWIAHEFAVKTAGMRTSFL